MYHHDFLFAHGPMVGAFGFGPEGSLLGASALLILALVFSLWSIVWMGLGLWHAAHNRQGWWFIAFLLIHTLGILEIIYLFRFRKDRDSTPLLPWHHEKKEKPVTTEARPADEANLPTAESSPE